LSLREVYYLRNSHVISIAGDSNILFKNIAFNRTYSSRHLSRLVDFSINFWQGKKLLQRK